MKPNSNNHSPIPRISAVVRAYNEGEHIGRLLEGLEQQTVKVDQIVLVDSGSTDNTVTIAESAGCTIVRIAKDEFSFGRALNRGFEATTGEVILVMSAHVYPVYDSYVEHMISALDRPGVGVAYGRQVGDDRTKFSESRVMLQWFPEENIWDQGHPFSNNANAVVSRDLWDSLRYDESLTGLEDLEFAQRAIAAAQKVAYVADAPVVHVHEETWQIIRNRYRREAIAYARITDDSQMAASTAIRLALNNIVGDYRDATAAGILAANLLSIPWFRIAQFVGAWEGFRLSRAETAELAQRFYYPPDKKTSDPMPEPGRRIHYTPR